MEKLNLRDELQKLEDAIKAFKQSPASKNESYQSKVEVAEKRAAELKAVLNYVDSEHEKVLLVRSAASDLKMFVELGK